MIRMIADTANLLFRVAAAQNDKYGGTTEERAALAIHSSMQSLNKYYRQYQPDQVILTFEGRNNWRKTYTMSEACVSGAKYKGNRKYDSTHEVFFMLIEAFQILVRDHTSLICLQHELLEGDDLIGGLVHRIAPRREDEIIIISGDKDFVQLLEYDNVVLINPDTGKPRTVESVCGKNDAQYFKFEKCMRGDGGDNVMSAYPRLRTKKIEEAYSDTYKKSLLLNEEIVFTDPESGERSVTLVGDRFRENELLMMLDKQPDDIKKVINEVLDTEMEHFGKFSMFHFTRFCGKYNLKSILEQIHTFAPLFSANSKSKSEADAQDRRHKLFE